jgi:hypothetical protein
VTHLVPIKPPHNRQRPNPRRGLPKRINAQLAQLEQLAAAFLFVLGNQCLGHAPPIIRATAGIREVFERDDANVTVIIGVH